MRAATSLHRHQAGWLVRHESLELRSRQLLAEKDRPVRGRAVPNVVSAPVHDYAEVIIARDGDACGSKAESQILRAASSLAAPGLTVMMASPPEGRDFNDVLVNEGDNAVRNRIAGAENMNPSHADTRNKNLAIGSEIEIAKRVHKDLNAKYGHVVHAEGVFWRYCDTE